ncbi:MAG: phage tail protein I [Allobaculum sp.]|nr:phage tail protein I [Allobaculum sp.]
MKLNDLKFLKLLPVFMRKDKDVIALSQAMDNALRDTNDHLKTASGWNAFDKLTEAELDEMAWEFDVDWYDYGASREVKAAQIKSAQLIKQRRGTTWAVSQIVSDVFGAAYVKEWPEFNGNPYEFDVVTTNPQITQEKYDQVVLLINKAKNVRSILRQIYYTNELIREIEIQPQVHDGTFTLPFCGIAHTATAKMLIQEVNHGSPIPIEVTAQESSGFFILLEGEVFIEE